MKLSKNKRSLLLVICFLLLAVIIGIVLLMGTTVNKKEKIGFIITGSIDETQEVVVPRVCLSLLAPGAGTPEVGTYGEHYGCLPYHGLVEMSRSQPLLHILTAGYHDTVKLQVTHGLRTCRSLEQALQQFLTHFLVAVLTYAATRLHNF